MGQVRWAGWAVALAATWVLSAGQVWAGDFVPPLPFTEYTSDKLASLLIYPKIEYDSSAGKDTVIRLTNTDTAFTRDQDGNVFPPEPVLVHCFYLDANSHCRGGSAHGEICTSSPSICTGGGVCVPGWVETDFRINLTPGQPIEWLASEGLADDDLPLQFGFCAQNPFIRCGRGSDCERFNAGNRCTESNVGTRIPRVAEDPFVGELKCLVVDDGGHPVDRDVLKGEAILTTFDGETALYDTASYNALGFEGAPNNNSDNTLILGGPEGEAEYSGCPTYLIMNHFFDDVAQPVPNTDATIRTSLVLVPCSQDLLRQVPGAAVVQFLIFNEFEQRFSTSRSVTCYEEIDLCKIASPNCDLSIFNAQVAGTVTGQTRMQGIASPALPGVEDRSGILGIAIQRHIGSEETRSAAFHLGQQGQRSVADKITIPVP